eukprot:scaffold158317_cov28-Tisochrysis_lutea.AAC.2
MVPEFDQPRPASTPPPPSRSRRNHSTAVRTSSLAPLCACIRAGGLEVGGAHSAGEGRARASKEVRAAGAHRYAENSRGDVTGELPHARILITATCQPRSAAAAAIERTYVSCEPPPSPEASSSIGLSGLSGGGWRTKAVSIPSASSSAPAMKAPRARARRRGQRSAERRAAALRTPASRSSASVPPSGVVSSCR